MASTLFNFSDFKAFAGIKQVNEATYVTIAKGVLELLEGTYGIYMEPGIITKRLFLNANQKSIPAPVFPINDIISLTYDGDIIESTAYSWYGEDILMTSALVDTRKPLDIKLDVGFTTGVPSDLKLAIYRHMMSVYFDIDKSVDNIEKSVNSQGNTTYFSKELIPLASSMVYDLYTTRTLMEF